MSQPQGFEDPIFPNYVYKLHKVIYGLKQVLRAWFVTFTNALLQMDFTKPRADT